MLFKRSIVAAALLVLVATGAPRAATHVVTVQDAVVFTPDNLQIQQGDFVEWQHVGNSFNHTTTNGTGALDPNAGTLWDTPLAAGESFIYQFNDAGTFDYFCRPHEGVGMTGQIVVAHSIPLSNLGGKIGLLVLLGLLGVVAIWRRRVATSRS